MSIDYRKDLAEAAIRREEARLNASRQRTQDLLAADERYVDALKKAEQAYAEAELHCARDEALSRARAIDDAVDEVDKAEAKAMNRDPLSGATGSHPVGTAIGTTSGAVAGAFAGAIAGPVGTALGGFVGALVGAVIGHESGEELNPTADEDYWRDAYLNGAAADSRFDFADYAPAFRVGAAYRDLHADREWDRAESDLAARWDIDKGSSRLRWEEASSAARAAWQRRHEAPST